ncbi:hypothetical protein F0919_09035 [Taibaiella lutea]|uniref:LptE family protein n=1 Tax=Taibaiella lutea TaxID=2608001 RepID=A0A5M6CIB0_9BACT|nr:LptE family protein [Taibaiella lutea]KAA5534746.1 hypothetical protein F0919_09035 [Taibaiella lutea]
MKSIRIVTVLLVCAILPSLTGCGVYSLTGASITGKTINIHNLENRAPNVAPSLSAVMTGKMREKILSQTGLASVNTDAADYDMEGTITAYNVSYTGVQTTAAGQTQASQNRLTITVEVDFKNKKDDKASFKQSFTRFADFPGDQQLSAAEPKLIDDISTLLAQDIFNKAFVNW